MNSEAQTRTVDYILPKQNYQKMFTPSLVGQCIINVIFSEHLGRASQQMSLYLLGVKTPKLPMFVSTD